MKKISSSKISSQKIRRREANIVVTYDRRRYLFHFPLVLVVTDIVKIRLVKGILKNGSDETETTDTNDHDDDDDEEDRDDDDDDDDNDDGGKTITDSTTTK